MATRVYLLSLSPATIVSVQFAAATDEMAESRDESYRADAGDFGSRTRTPRVEDVIDEWRVPLTTRLGRQPKKDGEIETSDDIHAHSECEIVDYHVGTTFREEVLRVIPVRVQTTAGQCTRYHAIVAISDPNGRLGLGVKCSGDVTTAVRGATACAKLAVVPVRRGYWGKHVGKPHTVPREVTAMCGSACVRLIPAPRGTGIVSVQMVKKLLTMAGFEDCYTTVTTGTVVSVAMATYSAIARTCYFV